MGDRHLVRRPWYHQIPELKELFKKFLRPGEEAAASATEQFILEESQEAVTGESFSTPCIVIAEDSEDVQMEEADS